MGGAEETAAIAKRGRDEKKQQEALQERIRSVPGS